MTGDPLDMSFGTPLGDAVGKLIVSAAHDQPTVLTAGEAGALFDCMDRLRPLAAMLNGAAARRAQPAREDPSAEVAARLAPKWSQPQTGPVGEARAALAALIEEGAGLTFHADIGPHVAAWIVDSQELAELVNAVRVEELERAAAMVERQLEPARFGSWRDPGCAESAYRDAARIVRDMAGIARNAR